MMAVKKKKQIANLATGRPPTAKRQKSMSRRATKSLINTHHLLAKRKRQAAAEGDKDAESAISAEIEALGGLNRYQQASLQGQRSDRGGDSSRVLMEWLKEDESLPKPIGFGRLRMLEIGALSVDNACSKSGRFDIERIDLNSQEEGILQQDFMKRPLPRNDEERFDIISLSLVLNFVPNPADRGDMLLRTLAFLHEPDKYTDPYLRFFYPSLFLVLPAPCVYNSRYLDATMLEAIMNSLGYGKAVRSKTTQRLAYSMWKRTSRSPQERSSFLKRQVRTGASRNNFAIVLRQQES
jgi:25S rRNA (adenine2142-N1)-methyltransferase